MRIRFLFCFLFCVVFVKTHAQDYSDSWKGYFSYNNITAFAQGKNNIYAAAGNAVFSYDINADKIETITTVNGLSGGNISAIYFSQNTSVLFIGYDSGIIDVVRKNKDVLTVVDIENKASIPPDEKRINNFYEYEGFLYIASDFGISLYDIDRLEFGDSYFIGPNGSQIAINQVAIYNEYIYASSRVGGVRRALANADNLVDYHNWESIAGGAWLGIGVIGQDLYAISSDSFQKFENGGFVRKETYPELPKSLKTSGDLGAVVFNRSIALYNAVGSKIEVVGQFEDFPTTYNTTMLIEDDLYIGTIDKGVLITVAGQNDIVLQVVPEGPLRNDIFSIEAAPDELWVVFGDYTEAYNPYPLKKRGLSHLVNEAGWVNYHYDEIFQANNLVNITINPKDHKQVYISSYNSGLLEIQDGFPVKLYDETNSGLSDIEINPTDVRVNGAAFSSNGDLWMTNSQVKKGIAKKSGNQIQGISIEPITSDFNNVNFSKLELDASGNVYAGTNNNGIIAYNPNSNTFANIEGEEDGANMPDDDVKSLAIDNNGVLWIGTARGLRLLYGPAQVFSNEGVQTRPIVIVEDNIPVELLNDQVIQTIEVDGSNNKWIGTVSNGVFYFSSDGQETIYHFDISNSPLPSNNVQDVTIDDASGEVYFATPNGLVSFAGRAVAASEDLAHVRAFPNPVRPSFSGLVTIDGLTENANVKITDITGNLVHEAVSEGGSIQWDTTAFGDYKVASGVYLILITSKDALETKIAKLMIIR